MKRTRIILASVLAGAVLGAAPALAQDRLDIISLSPASGTVTGLVSGPMGPGNSVQVTLSYVLESAPQGKIGVYTAGVAGNPAHTGVEIPVMVKKGKGRVQTRFSVKCAPGTPAVVAISRLRYALFATDAGGGIVRTLVERFRPVQYKFVCRDQVEKKPDITALKGITLGGAVGGAGGKFVPWGGSVTLTQADSFLQSGGKCAYNVSYQMRNQGSAPTSPAFWNRLRSDSTVVSQQSGLSLAAGQTKTVNTQAYLPPGGHVLSLSLDDDHAVAESNEGNNVFKIRINVRCPGEVQKKPDLISLRGITIGGSVGGAGGKFVPWGGSVTLTQAESFRVSNGRCAFNISYIMKNDGAADAAPAFWNRLRSDSTVVSQQSGLTLAAGHTRTINTQAYLPAGGHVLSLTLDDTGVVAESNEGNNKYTIRIMVRCPTPKLERKPKAVR
jgi:hypothetical protein